MYWVVPVTVSIALQLYCSYIDIVWYCMILSLIVLYKWYCIHMKSNFIILHYIRSHCMIWNHFMISHDIKSNPIIVLYIYLYHIMFYHIISMYYYVIILYIYISSCHTIPYDIISIISYCIVSLHYCKASIYALCDI